MMGQEITQDTTYDFVFIGLGAGNSLILLSLIQRNLLKNRRVIVFEADSKTENDKTYCFWSAPNEAIVTDLAPIISHSYNTIQINQSSKQNIVTQPYNYIRSIDLYAHTLQVLTKEKIKIIRTAVNEITCKDEIYTIHSQKSAVEGRYIFDSRPPKLIVVNKNEIYLHQSFHGMHIKCSKKVFEKDTFEMMNFNVDQDNFTQFVYVIPFSEDEALVELTRFGAKKIAKTYALEVLKNFIFKNFGAFEIIASETGCIPMTTFINPPNASKGILNTGASANLIKPSTGYGFKKMHAFAQLVSQRVEKNNLTHFNKIALPLKSRFLFYDRLLLLILMIWPHKGKPIFTHLFNKQSIMTVFSFLDEKTSLLQEVKIFSILPIFTFLKALFFYLKSKSFIRYILAFFIVSTYFFLAIWSLPIADYFSYLVIIVGLLIIGIPHGSLDYLLSKNKESSLIIFILKYILIISLYFVFWQFFPVFSLIIFVMYSAFHFGESEIIEIEEKTDTIVGHLKAFMLGLSILSFIIFTHLQASINVISHILDVPELTKIEINYPTASILGASISFIYILYQLIISKERAYFGLLLLLLLGVKVPLILAFGLYFIFQHSFNAWHHLKLGLKMNSLQLYKKSLIYNISSLIIYLLFVFWGKEGFSFDTLFSNFFIFISCISLPHFILMHVFYKTEQNI